MRKSDNKRRLNKRRVYATQANKGLKVSTDYIVDYLGTCISSSQADQVNPNEDPKAVVVLKD